MQIPAPTELIVSKSSEAGAAANVLKLVQSVYNIGRSLSLTVLVFAVPTLCAVGESHLNCRPDTSGSRVPPGRYGACRWASARLGVIEL